MPPLKIHVDHAHGVQLSKPMGWQGMKCPKNTMRGMSWGGIRFHALECYMHVYFFLVEIYVSYTCVGGAQRCLPQVNQFRNFIGGVNVESARVCGS